MPSPKLQFKNTGLFIGLMLSCLLPSLALGLPSFQTVKSSWRTSEAYLLDRNGKVLQEARMDFTVRRLPWVGLDQVSPALLAAILTAEDRRFYQHHGVDWTALVSAALGRVIGKPPRGGSTLTMQLAAMLDPRLAAGKLRRSPSQKWAQLRAALDLEATWTKPEILEAYLNLVGFRGELQGIGATTWALFGKQPSGLAELEALVLVAVLPSPNGDAQRIGNRACAIAKAARWVADCPALQALTASVISRPLPIEPGANLAPHLARHLLKAHGERLTTTLEEPMQRLAFDALSQQLRGLADRNVRDGAAVVLDNATGDVLAYVGSAGPFSKSGQVDGVRARRQAGSTLKPFLYGLMLEHRYLTAASILDDAPIHLETTSGLYIPQNYDRDYKGLVSVRTALASSLNIPAVRALVLYGVDRFRDKLRDFGYLSINQPGEYYGFSLALGSAEVTLLEQANAYRTLANGGVFAPAHVQWDKAPVPARRVMAASAAFIVGDILADPAGRAMTFGLSNPLATRFWAAVKTGTSKDMRDNWCIGFNQKYTVGVWVGNFEGDSMHEVSGVTGAAPAWLEIMNALQEGQATQPPEPPGGLICRDIRYEPPVEPPRWEWFIPGTETEFVRMTEPATQAPRIASPANGVIIALDPDIPYENQAVVFTTKPAQVEADFVLDGSRMGVAGKASPWHPSPGTHQLKLIGQGGKVLDTVEFTVRGLNR